MLDYSTSLHADFIGIPKGSFLPRDYMLTADKIRTASSISDKRPTKQEQVESFIKENKVEVDLTDDNYIFLYKATNLEGKDDYSGLAFTVGKIFVVDKGIFANTYEQALKSNNKNRYLFSAENPSALKNEMFKIFKVRVNKSDIISVEDDTIKATQVDVIEGVILQPKMKYRVRSIQEIADGFNFTVKVQNDTTQLFLDLQFYSDKIDIGQDEIKTKIKERLDVIQKIYDKEQESNGEIEL